MASPEDRRYLQTHEWHKLDDGTVTIGISEFAVCKLTDITFIEITRQEGTIRSGEPFGEIESVKATSELFSGVDGTIIAVNQQTIGDPGIINEDPYGRGWLVKIKPDNPSRLDALMAASAYDAITGAEQV